MIFALLGSPSKLDCSHLSQKLKVESWELFALLMIFASLGIVQVNLTLLSLIAKIIRFAHDFCFARHSSSKLDTALAYRKNWELPLKTNSHYLLFYYLFSVYSQFPCSPFPTPYSLLLAPHSSFLISHSSFLIPHSSFLTPHSSLLIPHSSFLILNKVFLLNIPHRTPKATCCIRI